MATADDALNVARSYLGEGPRRFTDWYPASTSTPWCCIFQSFVLTQVGLPTHYAWVSGLFDAMRAEGRTFAPYEAQPGDLVAFDYSGNDGAAAYDHIAMVEYVGTDAGGAYMVCIDGNWANSVMRVKRYFGRSGYGGGIAEIARPYYSAPAPPAPPSPSPVSISLPNDEAPMRRFIKGSGPRVYLTDAGCMGKVFVTSEPRLQDFGYALRVSGVPVLDPPRDGKTVIIAGEKVWECGDAFVDSIPTIG